MKDMFRLIKDAKCKVILFHSASDYIDGLAKQYNLIKTAYYDDKYRTDIFTKNITLAEKDFFITGNNRGFYSDFLFVQATTPIIAKGV